MILLYSEASYKSRKGLFGGRVPPTCQEKIPLEKNDPLIFKIESLGLTFITPFYHVPLEALRRSCYYYLLYYA